jgi:alkylmercury lyase
LSGHGKDAFTRRDPYPRLPRPGRDVSSGSTSLADDPANGTLERLARALVSLPCTDRVSVAVLGLLATGYPVTRRDLASALGGAAPAGAGVEAEALIDAAMEQMPNLELDADGRIVGCGLTMAPTDHQIIFTGPPFYTWCAFDTVLFPALLGRSAEVRSLCHATGIPIRCSIGMSGLENLVPAAAVISLIAPEETACCDLQSGFCQQAHFFASPSAARAWRAAHETGHVLPVADAYTVARRIRALREGLT